MMKSTKSTDCAPHGFAVLSMIIKEILRKRPTRIRCALFFFKKILPQIAPHTDLLWSVLCPFFFKKIGPQSPTRIRCALPISNEIHRLRRTRICCALHDYQGNSQIAPHTDSLCSVCSFPPHRFAALFIISNEIHRLRPTRIHCTLHVFQENSPIASHTDSLCFVCSISRKSCHRVPHTDSLCSS